MAAVALPSAASAVVVLLLAGLVQVVLPVLVVLLPVPVVLPVQVVLAPARRLPVVPRAVSVVAPLLPSRPSCSAVWARTTP